METQAACIACKSGAPRFHFEVSGSRVVRCQRCGLGRAIAPSFEPSRYYTRDYFSGGRSDGYEDYAGSEPVLRSEFARTVRFLTGFRSGGRLLELGCAYGFFLQEAKARFDVAGLELSAEAAEACRRSGLDVTTGPADEATLARFAELDAVVLLDVVEHLADPLATLATVAKRLKPGGVILLTTGDFGSPLARLSGRRWRLMTPPQHLWFFTLESLRLLSGRCGLSLEHADHPWKLVPLSLIEFQLRRFLGLSRAPSLGSSRACVPINLFDALRVVLRKPDRVIQGRGTIAET